MQPHREHDEPPSPRSGTTIVEVLFAIMLLSLGLLAIAGSTTLALRSTLDAARSREAAHRATSRLALLSAGGCATATSGIVQRDDLREEWTVGAQIAGFRRVTDSVSWSSARGPRSFSLTSAIQC